jgi:hypothetical protein
MRPRFGIDPMRDQCVASRVMRAHRLHSLCQKPLGEHVRRLFLTFIVSLAGPAQAAGDAIVNIDDARRDERARAVKDILTVSAETVVRRLGREDGFLRDERAHIPLPDGLTRAATGLRRFGMGRYPAELEVNANRAAEAAVPALRPLLLESISQIDVIEMRAGLHAGETASQYFRRQTHSTLATRFLPMVREATRRLRVADLYQQVAGRASKVGLLRSNAANLDEYITLKALEAVYAGMAEEERALRAPAARQTQKTLRKVSSPR